MKETVTGSMQKCNHSVSMMFQGQARLVANVQKLFGNMYQIMSEKGKYDEPV